jgi:hypothetical protein
VIERFVDFDVIAVEIGVPSIEKLNLRILTGQIPPGQRSQAPSTKYRPCSQRGIAEARGHDALRGHDQHNPSVPNVPGPQND